SSFYHIDDRYYYWHPVHGYPRHLRHNRWYRPLTGQVNFQGEFGIHEYVGIGFTTGFGGRSRWNYGYSGEMNVPIGFVSNFHFYQLIADKSGKNIHADKLDIYFGGSLGSGV